MSRDLAKWNRGMADAEAGRLAASGGSRDYCDGYDYACAVDYEYIGAQPEFASTERIGRSRSTAEIKQTFTLRVLDDAGGHLASGTVAQLVGQRLIAQVSEQLKPDTCVQIDCGDSFVLGEILGCWREEPATFAAVKLLQALTGLQELAKVREQLSDLPGPQKVLRRA
jgi:hypothetical protein